MSAYQRHPLMRRHPEAFPPLIHRPGRPVYIEEADLPRYPHPELEHEASPSSREQSQRAQQVSEAEAEYSTPEKGVAEDDSERTAQARQQPLMSFQQLGYDPAAVIAHQPLTFDEARRIAGTPRL